MNRKKVGEHKATAKRNKAWAKAAKAAESTWAKAGVPVIRNAQPPAVAPGSATDEWRDDTR